MSKMSNLQMNVLASACQRDDGLVVRPANLKPAAAAKMVAVLRDQGFVREIRAKLDAPVWREDDEGKTFSLKILKAGREAVAAMMPDRVEGKPAAAPDPAVEIPGAKVIEERHGAMPIGDAAGSLRPGSKRALVLGLLQRSQGATIDDLMTATGWLPHTTRAFLSGLRKAGFAVERSRAGEAEASVYRIDPAVAAAAA